MLRGYFLVLIIFTCVSRFSVQSHLSFSKGIKIVERVEIPPELVPKDAQVEITAKVFGGYHGGAGYSKVRRVEISVGVCN